MKFRRNTIIATMLLLATVLAEADGAPRRRKPQRQKKAQPTRVVAKPRTSGTFITSVDAIPAPKGLDGKNIALWQSHGRYFDQKENRWTWQRARLMGTVEDLFPQAFVVPYLMPMLENAGAYVMTPRERDFNEEEVIVDADGGLSQRTVKETNGAHKWQTLQGTPGFGYTSKTLGAKENPFRKGTVRTVKTVTDEKKAAKAVWTADIPRRGEYAVYISYASLPDSPTDARYIVNSLSGTREFQVNQTMGSGTWVYLGTFPLAAGKQNVVELTGVSKDADKTLTADAVRIGGGMGNVARGGEVSTYPRWGEGARYWMQWAGIPASIYSVSSGTDDYEDDYKGRGMWVNYLAGGSRSLPGQNGLGIPVDLSFAFHTDAGTTSDPYSTVGTLPIISTSGEPLGNGLSRTTNRKLAEMVTNQIAGDIRSLYDPGWNTRKMRDKAYHEAREPRVPAMLLELLSHQNFADMRLGLDPAFRFDVSRAIYKGMLKYLHSLDGSAYVVAPLPVNSFAITEGENGAFNLSWSPTIDRLEPTAKPKYYIVYERVDSGAFSELAVVDNPYISVRPEDDRIYSYKIVAANDGGTSFPSEVLALCFKPGKEAVRIVNGFTRVSGPAQVYRDGNVGFDYAEDHGVPYIKDVHFTGEQVEFSPDEKWINNDAPGHGASRATHETEIVAGNTFDFVYDHGVAIRAAGHGFVSSSLEAFVNTIPTTRIVDLILGKQREITVGNTSETRFKPFTEELKRILTEFCDAGGALFVSGSYIGSDLFDNSFSMPSTSQADRSFAHNILGISWLRSKATIEGSVKEVRGRYSQFRQKATLKFAQQLNPRIYAVESPESFAPANPAEGSVILRYTENDLIAGTASVLPTHRVVVIGFPFETIISTEGKAGLMSEILEFLSVRSQPSVADGARITVYPETMIVPTRAHDVGETQPFDPATLAENEYRGRKRRNQV